MCIAAKYIRETRNGRTLEREILLPNPKVFSPKSVGAVAIVNTCFGIRAATKDLKKTRRKETYLFRMWYRQMDTVAVTAGCQKYDRRG